MTGKLKKLRIYGILYFIFACANVVNVLIGVVKGNFNAIWLVDSGLMNESLSTFVVGIEFVVMLLVILAYLCLALKGYTYGIGEGFGYAHVKVSQLMPWALFIQLGLSVLTLFAGRIDYISIVTAIVGLCTIYSYNRCARVALES